MYSHCNYAEILSNLGIVGFVLYYCSFFLAVFGFRKIMKKTAKHQLYASYNLAAFLLGKCNQYTLLMIIAGSRALRYRKDEISNIAEQGVVRK